VNSMARAADYAHYFGDCGARIAIVHSSAVAEFLRGLGESPQATVVLAGDQSTFTGGVKCLRWSDWISAASTRLNPAATTPFDPAALLYTSGSGGTPNGAVHEHKDMLVASRGFAQEVLGLGTNDITFSVSKLFFAYGLRSSASTRGGVTGVGWPTQSTGCGAHRAVSATAGSVLVSEPPLPHRRCGLVGGRCVRAAQLARVRRRVNWCRAGESTKESAREEGPLREA
jgi:acyl-coenzyme A synthetase/AMP-(fatty) acid ligase